MLSKSQRQSHGPNSVKFKNFPFLFCFLLYILHFSCRISVITQNIFLFHKKLFTSSLQHHQRYLNIRPQKITLVFIFSFAVLLVNSLGALRSIQSCYSGCQAGAPPAPLLCAKQSSGQVREGTSLLCGLNSDHLHKVRAEELALQ